MQFGSAIVKRCLIWVIKRFLPRYHPYRFQKKAFNNEEEVEITPKPQKREEILAQV